MGDFDFIPVRFHTQGERIVVLADIVGNRMLQLDGCRIIVGGFYLHLRSLAFLDVHGDMAHRGHPDVLVVLLGVFESIFNEADVRWRVVGIAVVLARETVREE